jgi:F0F1-type ATP synthase delta subunit
MKQSSTKIANFIAQRTLHGTNKHFSREVAAYLLSNHQVDELNSIIRDVQSDWAKVGIVDVMATSAHPITPAIEAQIRREVKHFYPKAKRIIVNPQQNPDIIGGVRLNFANRQLDLSIEAQLNKFKQLTSGKD